MNVDLSEFLPGIMHLASPAPAPVVKEALREVLADFCGRTRVIKATLDAVSVPAGSSSVELDSPSPDLRIAYVLEAKLNGETINGYEFQGQEVFFDEPVASVAALVCKVVLKPRRTAEAVPETLLEDHYEAIRAGTLAKLYNQKGKDWFDPAKAAQEQGTFLSGIAKARNSTDMQGRSGSSRVNDREFGF